jgi:hypothetical protein
MHDYKQMAEKGSTRFEAIYGNTREASCGTAFSPEASLERAGSKQSCVSPHRVYLKRDMLFAVSVETKRLLIPA